MAGLLVLRIASCYRHIALVGILVCNLPACTSLDVNVLPIDPKRNVLLDTGQVSNQYQLFTSRQYLSRLDPDVSSAMDRLVEREVRARGLCPNGYDLVKGSLGYAESGGGVIMRFNCRP